MSKRKKEKESLLPGIFIVAFLAAVITFGWTVYMEKEALSDYEKISVWCTSCDLAEGLELTKGGVTNCLVQVEIDKAKVPQRVIENPAALVGRQTQIVIPQGTILTEPMFTEEGFYTEGLYSPTVVGCKGDDLFQMVSGILRKGDRIHILKVDEQARETYLLWENIMVYQTFDSTGKIILPEDETTPAVRMNLLLEEGHVEQFYNELNTGTLRVVKVW